MIHNYETGGFHDARNGLDSVSVATEEPVETEETTSSIS
jgi:hypothetical protein